MSTSRHDIVVYTSAVNNRVFYTINHIFKNYFGLHAMLTNFIEDYNDTTLPKVNYSNIKSNGFDVKPYGLLFEKGITEQEIVCNKWENTIIFFETEGDLPFDIFSSTFFLLSRYEEYYRNTPDKHGRYKAESSVAFLNGFLTRPIVDEWLYLFAEKLLERFPGLPIQPKNFQHLVTVDIDQAYKFKSKGVVRNTLATLNELIHFNPLSLLSRLKYLTGNIKDPYDNYDFIIEQCNQKNIKPIFFFLLGKYSKFDKNNSPQKAKMKKIINELGQKNRIGLHPSYKSNKSIDILMDEIKTLTDITGSPVRISRQHFLKMKIPLTYKNLINLNITEDYTMGYPDTFGFRAGTSHMFFFYDLSMEKSTLLQLYPFSFMDSTFKYHLKAGEEQTIEKVKKIVDRLRNVNGSFISLWHNETFDPNTSTGKQWRKIFERVLEISQ